MRNLIRNVRKGRTFYKWWAAADKTKLALAILAKRNIRGKINAKVEK